VRRVTNKIYETQTKGDARSAAAAFFVPLESLRGLAALIVVIYHANWINPLTPLHFFKNGALLVDFFFVLSGFVIFHSYGRTLGTSAQATRFLWLRLGRLYPLHLTMLLVFLGFELTKLLLARHFVIVADRAPFRVNNGFGFTTNLLLIQSLGVHKALNYNYPSWSISTELYAYVLFAVVRSWWQDERAFATAAFVIVVGCVSILLAANVIPLSMESYKWGFLRCCAGFFSGVLTYISYSRLREQSSRRSDPGLWPWASVAALIAMVGLLCFGNPNGRSTYALPLLSAFVILSIVLWPQKALQSLLGSRPLRWLGKVSYSLYMVHAAIIWVAAEILTLAFKFPMVKVDGTPLVATPPAIGVGVLEICVLVTLLLSHYTYKLIEEPFRKRSRQLAQEWFPGDVSPPATSTPAPVAAHPISATTRFVRSALLHVGFRGTR
jgi:peptidoglycan/LPS O-acetylase OafA/YrhL